MPSSTPEIGEDTTISRNSALMVAPVLDETVMMNIENGNYYGLDDIGSDLWRRLENPCKFGELIDALAADYEAERGVIAQDVRKILLQMAEHKVVTLA